MYKVVLVGFAIAQAAVPVVAFPTALVAAELVPAAQTM